MDQVHAGGCLCGAIRYRVRGLPARTLVCHCTFCQHFTGSAYNVESIFPKENIEFSEAALREYEHRSDGSGQAVRLHFCPRCGTTVSLSFDRFPQVQAISRGTFDDPNWVTVGAHIYVGSAQSGVVLPSGVDCFDQHRIQLNGTQNTAVRHDQPKMSQGVAEKRRPSETPVAG